MENIQGYGDLYNCLYDISAAGDQTAKRYLENSDPSIYVDSTINATYNDATCGKILKATAFAGGLASHANKQVFCINNWLGFLGSSSTPVIDTNDTGVIEIEIRLNLILFYGRLMVTLSVLIQLLRGHLIKLTISVLMSTRSFLMTPYTITSKRLNYSVMVSQSDIKLISAPNLALNLNQHL